MRVFRKLAQLLDVNVSGVADGDALVWDDGAGEWVPGSGGGGGGAPTDATYITQTANGDLDNEQALSSLATGLVKVTNGTGVLSTATGGTDYANASHQHAGEDITSGTVADARIASTIARDSEVASAVAALSSVYQAKDTTLDTYAGIDPAANVQSVLGAANYAAIRTLLDLEAGTDFPSQSTFDDHSARHEDGGSDEISIAGLSGTSAALQAHLDDTSAAHAASAVSADSTTLVGTGTDVQAVLEELDNGIADHLADSSAAHAASAISFSPTGTIAATDVQAAIAEVASEAGGSVDVEDANLVVAMSLFA